MSHCGFFGPIPSTLANLTELVHLNLSFNLLNGSIPAFYKSEKLTYIDLSLNSLMGSLSYRHFEGLSNLAHLDLRQNSLSGSIPRTIFALPSLVLLDLSHNQFSGQINELSSIVNFSIAFFSIDLSYNKLVGSIPDSFFALPFLVILQLSNSQFSGQVNKFSIVNNIGFLDLSSNRLEGSIPDSFFQRPSLEFFLPSNIIKNNITDSSINFLSLANNSLNGAIPASICNIFSDLAVLDLSFNNFTGILPPCVVEKSTENLQVLNLRGNNINGFILDQFFINCSLKTLDLSHNNLGGKIPKSLANCQHLQVMNVGYNNLDDNFPCMLSPRLFVLVLRCNKFHGEWRCNKSWPFLQILDLSSNHFSGSLHQLNFSTWRGMILQQNVAHLRPNRSSSNFLGEDIMSYYKDEVTLTVKGVEVNLVKIWPDFTSIDLSCNNFHGEIPDEVGNLTSLYLLNLSHNALTASIPKSLGALTELGSLDLSFNQLRGRIPEELAGLTFLSILNLSYNELVGKIPIGPQFNTFSANSFEGNTGLCGFPLNRSCSSTDGNGSTPPKEKDDEEEIKWQYVSAAAGYVVGLGSIAWILLFCRRLRERYFDKVEDVVENIFYRRDRRRRRRRGRTRVRGH